MIPNTKQHEVITGGVTQSASFGISMNDTAHIMGILRDQLYSDKILAVIREYSSNAWDAHKEVGKDDPIKVTIPDALKPTLIIEDQGPGLSHEAVFTVYSQYGASTKRNSDTQVGMLGIGSKSGFAYADSFTIVSKHSGKKRTYIAALDASEKGSINLLEEADCGDETGVAIHIAVKPEDIAEFTRTAGKFFQHFRPRPKINVQLPEPPAERLKLTHGMIYEESEWSNSGWAAVMGCVPYRVNLSQLSAENNNGLGIAKFISKISGALHFDIGALQVSASREELKYSPATRLILIEKFSQVVDEYVTHSLDLIENGEFTPFERRVRAQILRQLELPIPKDAKYLTDGHVDVKPDPKTFSITVLENAGKKGKKLVHATVKVIGINKHARFIIRDDDRALNGFGFNSTDDYIVRPVHPFTTTTMLPELESTILAMGIKGIKIDYTSKLSWTAPDRPMSEKHVRHKARTFKLIKNYSFHHPWGENWEIEVREPSKDDVYAVLSSFKTHYGLYACYSHDAEIAAAFDRKMPEVYGYKTTEKRPIDKKKLLGTEYSEWRKEFLKNLAAEPEVAAMLEEWEWTQSRRHEYHHESGEVTPVICEKLAEALGKDHLITTMITRRREAQITIKRLGYAKKNALQNMHPRIYPTSRKLVFDQSMEAAYKKYPMTGISNFQWEELWGRESNTWLDYIKLVDRLERKKKHEHKSNGVIQAKS